MKNPFLIVAVLLSWPLLNSASLAAEDTPSAFTNTCQTGNALFNAELCLLSGKAMSDRGDYTDAKALEYLQRLRGYNPIDAGFVEQQQQSGRWIFIGQIEAAWLWSYAL